MKQRSVKAVLEDEAIYAEVEGHVDAELYEIARRDGGPIALRVTKVLALRVCGLGGIWVDDGAKERENLDSYLRERWLSGEDQPMVFPEEIEDTGVEFVVPSKDQPLLLNPARGLG